MSKEDIPLQIGLFTGEMTDTRTRSQKRNDRDREKPQQTEMFSQREIAQFGVRAHPLIPLSPHTKLVLIREDPRTEEEKEHDRLREAERLTSKLFPDNPPLPDVKSEENTTDNPPVLPVVSRPASIVGFRALQRRKSIHVRTRMG